MGIGGSEKERDGVPEEKERRGILRALPTQSPLEKT